MMQSDNDVIIDEFKVRSGPDRQGLITTITVRVIATRSGRDLTLMITK